MELSITSSAAFGVRQNGKVTFQPHLGIAQSAQAGFKRMEYNFLTGGASKPLAGDNWRQVVTQLRQSQPTKRFFRKGFI